MIVGEFAIKHLEPQDSLTIMDEFNVDVDVIFISVPSMISFQKNRVANVARQFNGKDNIKLFNINIILS